MVLGMDTMLYLLGGNKDSVKAIKASTGKEIESLALEGDRLCFKFVDGTRLSIFDDGQSCCESRYMVTDDDLSYYAGATFQSAEVADAPSGCAPDDDCHEVQFLRVTTSKGVLTAVNHNEHNGYYGGFALRAYLKPTESPI